MRNGNWDVPDLKKVAGLNLLRVLSQVPYTHFVLFSIFPFALCTRALPRSIFAGEKGCARGNYFYREIGVRAAGKARAA